MKCHNWYIVLDVLDTGKIMTIILLRTGVDLLQTVRDQPKNGHYTRLKGIVSIKSHSTHL